MTNKTASKRMKKEDIYGKINETIRTERCKYCFISG